MPWECIPEDELIYLQAKPQERAPYDCCRRFGKSVCTFLRVAGAMRFDVGKEGVGFHLDFLASPEQQSLRSHRDSAKVTTAITDRFSDDCKRCCSETLLQISA